MGPNKSPIANPPTNWERWSRNYFLLETKGKGGEGATRRDDVSFGMTIELPNPQRVLGANRNPKVCTEQLGARAIRGRSNGLKDPNREATASRFKKVAKARLISAASSPPPNNLRATRSTTTGDRKMITQLCFNDHLSLHCVIGGNLMWMVTTCQRIHLFMTKHLTYELLPRNWFSRA